MPLQLRPMDERAIVRLKRYGLSRREERGETLISLLGAQPFTSHPRIRSDWHK